MPATQATGAGRRRSLLLTGALGLGLIAGLSVTAAPVALADETTIAPASRKATSDVISYPGTIVLDRVTVSAGDAVEPKPEPTPVSVDLTAQGATYGQVSRVRGTVTTQPTDGSESGALSGVVEVTVDGEVFGSADVSDGAFVVPLPRDLAAGEHDVVVAWAGDDATEAATGEVVVRVGVARPNVHLSVSPKQATVDRTRVRAVVRVALPKSSVEVTGRVKVRINGRTVHTLRLVDGRAVVRLDAFGKVGVKRIVAVNVVSESVRSRTSSALTVRVTR